MSMQDDRSTSSPSTFSAEGHPVHTRSLEVDVEEADDGHVRASGRILDLRKHGFVPTGGDLQMSGFIHNMMLDALVDPETRILEVLEPTQPVVAYEASPRTAGESCRDTAHRLRDLGGERLDEDFAKKLSGRFGGPLGCSHLLTLAHLLASTMRVALDLESSLSGPDSAREPGERIFKRSLVIDGLEQEDGARMALVLQQNDVHTTPYCQVDTPLDRFRHQHEIRVRAHVDLRTLTIIDITGEERARDRDGLVGQAWQSRAEVLGELAGGPALGGLALRVRDLLREDPQHVALRDVLLNLAPGLIQCMAAMAHRMVEGGRSADSDRGSGPSILQLGGQADSCYIWRSGGPGLRARSGWTGEA